MLTTQTENSEKDLLNRISLARSPSEPVEPTEEPKQEPVEQEDDEPLAAKPEESKQEELEETEEADDDSETPEANNEDEELYIDLDGEEIALSQVKEWKDGTLRQSDYTKKTTALAEERKAFEAERSKITELEQTLQQKLATVDAILAEETLTPEQVAELKEYEPDEYIKYTEKLAKRKEAVSASKLSTVDKGAVSQKLTEANPNWLEDGKPTKQFTDDMALVRDYTTSLGYPQSELAGIEQNGDFHHWSTLLDAARGKKAIEELAKLKATANDKRNRKAPIVTKPKGKGQSNLERQIDKARAKFKESGDVNDAYTLKKLIKQRGNT